MKTNNKCAAVRLEKSNLVAALAILAVAFVIIAAVPAVVDDSDATDVQVTEVSTFDQLKSALEKDGSIKLAADISATSTLSVTNKNVIDLNDKTITGTSRVFTILGSLDLEGKGTITTTNAIKNNELVVRVSSWDVTTGEAAVTIGKDVIINAPYSYGLGVYGQQSSVVANIYGTITSAKTAAISTNGSDGFEPSVINIYPGAVIKSTATGDNDDSAAIYFPGRGTINMSGGTLEGVGSGIAMKSGTLNMSGGTITATGNAVMPPAGYSNGINASGAAIQIESNKSYYGNPDCASTGNKNPVILKITGGTLESRNAVAIYEYLSNEKNSDGSQKTTNTSIDSISINNATLKSALTTDIQVSEQCVAKKAITINGGSFSKAIDFTQGITISVADKSKLVADIKFSTTGQTIAVANGGAYEGTVSFTTKVDGKDVLSSAKIALKASGTGVTISAGSVTVTGNVVSGDGTAGEIAAAISGISGDVVLSGVTVASGNLTLGGTVTIENTALTVSSGATVTIKGTVKQDKTTISGEAIEGAGKIDVLSGATITGVNLSNTLAVDIDESVMSNTEVAGDFTTTGTQTVYTINQIITVAPGKTWTLVPGADVVIQGKLVVPEGSKIVISEGAKLTLDAKNAIASIEGDIEVNDKAGSYNAGEFIVKMGTVEFGASATIDGILTVGSTNSVTPTPDLTEGKVKIAQDAVLTIGESGTLRMIKGAIEVEKSGTFVLNGKIENADLVIANSGTVKIDSSNAATKGITINQMVDGAVVDIVRFTVASGSTSSAKIVISDEDLQFASYKDGKETKYVTNAGEKNDLTLSATVTGSVASASIKDVKAVSNATSVFKDKTDSPANGIYNKKVWTKTMDIAGTLGTGYILTEGETEGSSSVEAKLEGTYDATTDPAKNRAYAVVSGSFTLAENAKFTTVPGAYVKVTGTLDAVTEKSTLNNVGKIAVDKAGEVLKRGPMALSNITGTEYVVSMKDSTGSTVKVFHYVTLDAALKLVGADIKEIKVCGTQAVTEDATLPAEVTLTAAADGDITIGKKAGDTAKLTIAKGAKVKGAVDITVYGTLYAEDKSNIASTSGIVSDVYSEEIGADGKAPKNGWAEWTNLASAVSSGSNKTITVSKTDGYVEIANNLTIPAGTTVIVPSDAMGILIKNGVTLTVAGILRTEVDVFAEAAFDTVAKNIESTPNVFSSTIVVTGELQSAVKFNYAD